MSKAALLARRIGKLAGLVPLVVHPEGLRVARLAGRLALLAGCPPRKAQQIELVTPLRDIGHLGISDTLLAKPGPLEPEEKQLVQRHTVIGARILNETDVPLLHLAGEIAHSHHQHWDGSGYPLGLAGEAIPAAARVVAIADAFEALIADRPDRRAWSVPQAVAHLQAEAGRQFDPGLVALFLDELDLMLTVRADVSDAASPDVAIVRALAQCPPRMPGLVGASL